MTGKDRIASQTLEAIIEAILFATDRPVTLDELDRAIPDADGESIAMALVSLGEHYEQSDERGVDLSEVAGGYQIMTRASVGDYVERFLVGKRRSRLSRAALETLATIAYKQPITRGEVEELRGVDSGHVLHRLMERDLITVKGRSEALGRPLLYGTTTEFLRFFGIGSIDDMPNLEEFEALTTEDPLEDPEIRQALETEGLLDESDEDLLAQNEEGVIIPIATNGESTNGHAENGHAENGHATNGHAENGHAENGHPENGHPGNGHATNGHAENGHATNGHGNGRSDTNGNGNGSNGSEDGNGNGHSSTHSEGTNGDDTGVSQQKQGAFHAVGQESGAVAGGDEPPTFEDDEVVSEHETVDATDLEEHEENGLEADRPEVDRPEVDEDESAEARKD